MGEAAENSALSNRATLQETKVLVCSAVQPGAHRLGLVPVAQLDQGLAAGRQVTPDHLEAFPHQARPSGPPSTATSGSSG